MGGAAGICLAIELGVSLGNWGCRTFRHGVHQVGSCLRRILDCHLLLFLLLGLELFALLVLEVELFRFFLSFLLLLFVLGGEIFPLLLSLDFGGLLEFLLQLLLFFFQGLGGGWLLGRGLSSCHWWPVGDESHGAWGSLLGSKGDSTSCLSLPLFLLIDLFGLSSCLSLGLCHFVLL